jgi:hypothetical protein
MVYMHRGKIAPLMSRYFFASAVQICDIWLYISSRVFIPCHHFLGEEPTTVSQPLAIMFISTHQIPGNGSKLTSPSLYAQKYTPRAIM